jgi:hypothetical protein
MASGGRGENENRWFNEALTYRSMRSIIKGKAIHQWVIILVLLCSQPNIAWTQSDDIAPVEAAVSKVDSLFKEGQAKSFQQSEDGRILWVYTYHDQVLKLSEKIDLSDSNRLLTEIYFSNGQPIKIIEEESQNGQVLFKETSFIFNWEEAQIKSRKKGKRMLSEAYCGIFELEPLIQSVVSSTKRSCSIITAIGKNQAFLI